MKILCPDCGEPAQLARELVACTRCRREFNAAAPIFDFVSSPDRARERAFYDDAYSGARKGSLKREVESVRSQWHLPQAPENEIVLERVGDLTGKTVLLLGNGDSVKELIFLTMNPVHLVYSDLSIHALVNIFESFNLEEYEDRLIFAAVDAHHIPFADDSFDVIYGFAMVHHLPHLDQFFESVFRTLKPGGRAIFMDDAYAPLWHHSKQTWLKPLMKYSQKKTGISPEDYRFSMTGGFKKLDLTEKIRAAGGDPWFERASFITYLFYRGAEKLFPERLNQWVRKRNVAGAVRTFDQWLCKLPILRENQIRLVWGLNKPANFGAESLAPNNSRRLDAAPAGESSEGARSESDG